MTSEIITQQNNAPKGVDHSLLFDLIKAMNLAGRNLVAYPVEHPMVIASYERVEGMFQRIFKSRTSLSFRIARDALYLGSIPLDRKNPVFRGFARSLFRHGIVGLIFHKGLNSSDLMVLDRILAKNRDDVYKEGGAHTLLLREKVRHIRVRLLDYGVFQAENDASAGDTNDAIGQPQRWGRFVGEVLGLGFDAEKPDGMPSHGMGPVGLAYLLNSKFTDKNVQIFERLDFDVLFGDGFGGSNQSIDDGELLGKFIEFVNSLEDALRSPFLERFLDFLRENDGISHDVLSVLPMELIIDILQKHAQRRLDISPNILDVLQRLNETAGDRRLSGTNDDPMHLYSREELAERFKTVFREDEVDRFVPLDYQAVLHDFINAEDLTAPELFRLHQLTQTLSEESIDVRLISVIVEIIAAEGIDNVSESLKKTLRDRCTSLIRTGDFDVVLNVFDSLGKNTDQPDDHNHQRLNGLADIFLDDGFIEEVIAAAAQSGKEKRFYSVGLIRALGSPCVKPLLDRLAEENDRTLRQSYLDLLIELGPSIRDEAIERLHDHRWYVVRNIIILLRHLSDPTTLASMHNLLDHPHPKVRHELLHTLIKFNDPIAERLLLEEIESPDTTRQLRAIGLAGMIRSRAVSDKLVGLLKRRGFKTVSLGLKKASVHALSEIGDPCVLPALQHILKSKSWFSRENSTLLKVEIIKSLGKYPPHQVYSTLRALADSGPPVLANQAASVLNTLKENVP